MKLYYAPGACSLSPHIVARECGLSLQLVRVDTRTHLVEDGSDFYQVNSRGYVPVLELDDGTRMREGTAIVQFLADAVPQAGLVAPTGTRERVRAQEWLNFIATEYHKQFIWILRGATGEVLGQQLSRIHKVLAELNRQLGEQDYLGGEGFSIVDAYAFTITRWCGSPQANIELDAYLQLRAYMARVAARPAVQHALLAEGLVRP